MELFKFLSAVITRALFILVALIGVYRVTWVKKDKNYWFLTLVFLPLVAEMIITLKCRQGKDYKWVSPPIFLFLISIIPSIWILELHHQQYSTDLECKTDSLDSLKKFLENKTSGNQTINNYLTQFFSTACSNDWILALHQIVLILLILGRWILPLGGGVTRDELSQLLLMFVGTAADILEFNSETLSDIPSKDNMGYIYTVLAVWTWSMLQFPLHLAVVNSAGENDGDEGIQEDSLLSKRSTDIWSVVQALFIQDGPFLVVRLTIMIKLKVLNQMGIFFAFKNFLVVILNLYRLAVICQDVRPSSHEPVSDSVSP
ncbi:transmembrane protein 26-like [Odontesthes bonariensis]|uniref:transmembrane protein 26-like n=1 Tax=Odontesthes bonariensis TaxID=219752 RepID=UPI003F58F515